MQDQRSLVLVRFAPALLALAGALLLHAGTLVHAFVLTEAGVDDQLSVGILAPMASVWLVWERRALLAALPLRPWWPGLVAVVASSALWTAGALVDIHLISQLSLVAMLMALAATVMGRSALRILAFPLLFLLFGLSAYEPLVPVLMQITAHLGVAALQASGLPISLQGLTIITDFGRWQVVEGCSGLDYVLIYAMAATLFAASAFRTTLARIMFVAAGIGAAMLANGARAWAIIYDAYLHGGLDGGHDLIGWVAFSLGFIALFAIGLRLSRAATDDGFAPTAVPREPVDAAQEAVPASLNLRSGMLSSALALVLVAIAPAALALHNRNSLANASLNGCEMAPGSSFDRDGATVLRYRAMCGGPLGVQQALDLAETLVRQVAPDAHLVTGTAIAIGDGRPIEAATLTTLQAGTTPVTYQLTYWYQIGTQSAAATARTRVGLKWQLARARLTGGDQQITFFAERQALTPH